MLDSSLFLNLCIVLGTFIVGYLINQIPQIKQFSGKNSLVIKLAIEIVFLIVVCTWFNTTEDKSSELQLVLVTLGSLISVLFIWHTSQLFWQIRKTSTDSSTDNTTTKLKSPGDWRRELLKVMKIDVEKRLNDSLYDNRIIRIATEDRNEEIGRTSVNASVINKQNTFKDKLLQPLRRLEVFGGRKTQLAAGKPIIAAFEESDISGRLLILGNPGAGKTTLLLELARDLIAKAEKNSTVPIPILFELTNWRDDKQIISNWLQADLKFRYNIPEKITREWLSREKITPLLDGLDELGLTRQRICVDKINEFLQSNSGLLNLVVCCREEEYQQGEAILSNLRGAVCLQELSEQQIQNYLKDLKCQHLWKGIKNDPEGLRELAKTPLFLNLIPVAYPDGLIGKGKQFNSEDERKDYQKKCRQELFDKYIERKLGEHHDRKGYKAEDVKWWLVWLAKTMKEQKLKEFYIEKMQPSYLENRKQRILYSLIFGLTSGLIYGLIYGLACVLFLSLFFSIDSFFIGGLFFGLFPGLIVTLLVGLFELIQHRRIQPMENIKVSFKSSFFIFYGIFIGLSTGLYTSVRNDIIIQAITNGSIVYPLIAGLTNGLIGGLIIALLSGINETELPNKQYANQAIKKSAKNILSISFIGSPILILFISIIRPITLTINTFSLILCGLGLTTLLSIGFAGIPVIQHFLLRLILWKNGSIPWNYARFLKYADERKLINQVGGRFTFIHDKLQEHFADIQL
ncbi:MAG: hypothetical protein AAFR83_15330 [Cyanobacteria bacterium J06629_18]